MTPPKHCRGYMMDPPHTIVDGGGCLVRMVVPGSKSVENHHHRQTSVLTCFSQRLSVCDNAHVSLNVFVFREAMVKLATSLILWHWNVTLRKKDFT